MTIGGLGAVGAINRFDQKKTDAKEGVDLKSSSSASISSSDSSSVAPRSSSVSKEKAKDFSRVLDETEKESKSLESNETLAGASSVQTQSAPVDRSKPTTERPEITPGRVSPEATSAVKTDSKPEIAATPSTTTSSIEEAISEIAASLEETADTELSMRHLSMRDFLTKMKDEFGIEPKSIVEAFAKLDQTALMAPPDQTAEAVLSQLNLKPEQLPKAERFYQEMLSQTGESALNETLAGVGAGITLNVLSEQDVAMQRLQQSIVNLNDSFARRDEAPVQAEVTPGQQPSLALVEPQVDSVESKPEEKSSDSKFASIGAALSAAAASLTSANSAGANNSDSNSPKQDSSKPRELNTIEAALASSGFSVPTAEAKATPTMAGTSTALASAMAGQTDGSTATNAQDLVRHAQILVKQGGGEMKMQLKPEGIGEVTLKVAVKDGQVAIQMMTESDSAKKLLESNLDDLKTSLAQNKLHIDAVKIEVGGEMAKQRFEQSQQDASREQARQMAQDFMGQFRQDREGFRHGFSDSSAFKNYQQPRRNPLPEIEPVVASSVSAQKTAGERRLNLVA